MTRRERLMATLRGEAVDRPPVCFYEINGLDEDPENKDPFNIYSDPSWAPLIELAREKSDRIVMRGVAFKNAPHNPMDDVTTWDTRLDERGSSITTMTVRAGRRTLTSRTRRDPDVNTTWTLEHLIKDADDLRAYLDLPDAEFGGEPDVAPVMEAERALGDTGIAMIDTSDPVCSASLFDLGTYTVIALTEPELFHRLLERWARLIQPRTEAAARALPGRLWRIYGPEYASPPYLPPRLFHEYVTEYDTPMVEAIQRYGGYARIHCHGRIKDILDEIAAMGCTGLDPIEPPPQGNVELAYVREEYGKQMVLFGNLEASEVENLRAREFERRVRQAVREGTAGEGRGFVLMPSACPYGRVLSKRALGNYRTMIRAVEE